MSNFAFFLATLSLGACLGVALMSLCYMAGDDDWK